MKGNSSSPVLMCIVSGAMIFAGVAGVWARSNGSYSSEAGSYSPVLVSQATSPPPPAQAPPPNEPAPAMLTAQQLQDLVAPIALYPDALLAQILAASAYPTQVVEAERFLQENPNLKGADLAAAVDKQDWDPSVKAMIQFPSVLADMDKNLSWTSELGDANVNQPGDVMNAVQVLRKQAEQAGNLKTTPQQTVTNQGSSVVIQPASPDVVYVPTYDPELVYGYPVPLWPGFYPWWGIDTPYISFGFGYPIAPFFGFGWGWRSWGFNWGHGGLFFGGQPYGFRSHAFYDRNLYFHGGYYGGNGYRGFGGANRGFAYPYNRTDRGFRGFSGTTNRGFSAPTNRGFSAPTNRGFAPDTRGGTRSGAFGGINRGGDVRGFSSRGQSSMGGGFRGGGGARGGGGGRR